MATSSKSRARPSPFTEGMKVKCVDVVTGAIRWTGVVFRRAASNGALVVIPEGTARYNRSGKELRYKFSSLGYPLDKWAGCAMLLKPIEDVEV